MKKTVLSLLIATFAAVNAYAQNESQTEYNFLRIPVSAHAAALGGDNISIIEDDGTLIFNNPALLSSVSDKTINFNYMNYMSGVNALSASYSWVVRDRATWAASAQYLDYGKMKETDENNNQTGEFSAKDMLFAGHFSYQLGKRWVGGISAKLINSYIGDYNSMAFGVDLGINYYDSEREWSLSAVVKNLGGQIKAYDEEYEDMPLDIQIGASKHFAGTPFRLSATLVDLNHLDYKFIDHAVVGLDLLLSDYIWIGGGMNFRRANEMKIQSDDDKESSHGAGWSIGGGINLDRFKLNLAYGKYHISSSSLIINVAYSL